MKSLNQWFNMNNSILIITPPSPFLLDERVFVNLGILKIAAVLENAGYDIESLDLSGIENYFDVFEQHLRSTSADTILFTTTTPQLPAVVMLANIAKTINPNIKLIAGGPHITLVSAAVKYEIQHKTIDRAHRALSHLESIFDVLVAGDGEIAVFEALKNDAPKLIDGDGGDKRLFMNNSIYESSPLPARHLVDMNSYQYSIEGHKATSLISQLGCPYGCNFCGGRNSKSLRVIRTRNIESVISEIEFLHKTYGYTGFMFYDDELNVNKNLINLMNSITELQMKLGVEFRLRGFIKSELFNDEQAKAMYGAGFRWVLCGCEAASPRILININKRATVDDNTKVIDTCRRHNLKIKTLMSIGHAGESQQTIIDIHDWLLKVKPNDFDCTVITTYPGSPYYDEAIKNNSMKNVYTFTHKTTGDRLHSFDVDFTKVAEYYKGNPNGGYHSYVFTDYISSEELVKMRDWVENSIRQKLGIEFNSSRQSQRYEHSMGQIPTTMLRISKGKNENCSNYTRPKIRLPCI
jgi:anaerobic magnesium-protoporphyrin IX monomethyl ester cyclase